MRIAGCTCGACGPEIDGHGNIDYGYRWDDDAQDYVARECPVAEQRRARSGGEEKLLEGRL